MPRVPTFDEFERRARKTFARVPADFRAGVDGLVVEREALAHPTLPDVYTLGECATGELDPADDLGVQLRSTVVLYYGSFVRLSELDPEFDWDYEMWETLVHEIRHHRETAAGEDALEEVDYAEDQNFARLEGEAFDPFFYRAGEPVGPGAWEVSGEVFVEREVGAREWASAAEIAVPWGDDAMLHLPRPQELGDVHLVALSGTGPDDPPVTVALVRRRGTWEALRGLFSAAAPRVLQSEAEARVERGAGRG